MTREETQIHGVEFGIINKRRGRVKIDHFFQKLDNKAKELFVEGRLYFQIAQLVENPSAMRETPVRFLGQEDPLEKRGYPLQYSWASLVAQLVKNLPACGRSGFNLWVEKIPWRRERLPTPVFWLGEFHGLYSPWGCIESKMTEWNFPFKRKFRIIQAII